MHLRIPEAEGFHHSLCNSREVRYDFCMVYSKSWSLPVAPVTSQVCFPSLFSSWIVTFKCPPAAAVHPSNGRASLAYLSGLDQCVFQQLCEAEGCVDVCGCRCHAQIGSLHHPSQRQQHAFSITVHAQPDVQSRGGATRWCKPEGLGLSSSGSSFLNPCPCNL